MRPFTETLPFDDALRQVRAAAVPITRTERVPLQEADGRVAAEDVRATGDVPPFDRAAMDGYAIIAADTDPSARAARSGQASEVVCELTCIERVFTGEIASCDVTRGLCVEVATGAPMPLGADAVVMVEETERAGDAVRIRAAAKPGQNIGRRAADIAAGQVVVSAGHLLTPGRIGALSATGLTSVLVFAQPAVGILSTGGEIVSPGQPLGPGQIYDINGFTLASIVRGHGGVAVPLTTAGDTLDALVAAIDQARACDVIVFSGGSSVGNRDLVIDALKQRGEVLLHGIAVKPGKPTVFGRVGDVPFFGMPGYPTSCLSNGYMLLVPLLRLTARLPPWEPGVVTAPLARRVASAPGRHQFYTVRLVGGVAEPAFKASGDITSMANADGYFEIDAATETVEAGTTVKVTLF